MVAEDWYFIYAAVDVTNKQFKYSIINQRNNSKRQESKTLAQTPEKLQEIGSLRLFGVNSYRTTDDKVANGQFDHFFLNIDVGWSDKLESDFLSHVATPPRPLCNPHCARCVGTDGANAARNICVDCDENYTLNSEDRCIRSDTDLFDYGYNALTEGYLEGPHNYVISDDCFLGHYQATIGFYIRKNYHPDDASTLRNFLTWGDFKVGIRSSKSVDDIVFSYKTTEMKLENFESSGKWNYISFRLTKNKVTGQLIGARGEILAMRSTVLDGWFKPNSIQMTNLDSIISLYSVNFFATSYLSAKLVPAPNFDCSIDCVKCTDSGYCKQCQDGPSNVDGTCPMRPVNFYNTRVENDEEHFPLTNYLPTEVNYRSRRFTFTSSYTPDQSVIEKVVVFRLNNLDHDGGDGNGVAQNYLSIYYEAPKTFYVRYHNRHLLNIGAGSPREFKVVLNGKPENPDYFIAVSFNGATNRFGGLIYNSSHSWNKFGFTAIGDMDFLTNHAYLHLSDEKMKSAEFRHMQFYYEHVVAIEYLWHLAEIHSRHIQEDCKFGTIRYCTVCRTGVLRNGHCLPHVDYDVKQERNQVAKITANISWSNTQWTGDAMHNLSFGLWFRREKNVYSTFGLVNIKVGNTKLYKLIVDGDNLIGVGYGNEKPNSVYLSNLTDTREKLNDWVYIFVNYDLVKNSNNVLTYNSNTRRHNYQYRNGNPGFELNTKGKSVTYELGFDDSHYNASVGEYRVTSLTFGANQSLSFSDVFRFITIQPRGCHAACKSDCSGDGICKESDRISNDLNLARNTQGKTEVQIGELKAFQSIKDIVPDMTANPEFDALLISFSVNVRDWNAANDADVDALVGNNKDIFVVISNDPYVVQSKRNFKITETLYKNAIFSAVYKDKTLYIYVGSAGSTNIVEHKVNLTYDLKNYSQFYVGAKIDYTTKKLHLNIFIQSQRQTFEIDLDTLPERVNANTGFYTHRVISELKCQCFGTRFEESINNYLEKINEQYTLLQVCESGCAQCAQLNQENRTTCLRCTKNNVNLLGRCVPRKSCKQWKTLREVLGETVEGHGGNDSEDDEIDN
jgi:hypothetical protein